MLFDRKQQTAIPIRITVSIAKWQVVFAVPRAMLRELDEYLRKRYRKYHQNNQKESRTVIPSFDYTYNAIPDTKAISYQLRAGKPTP